MNKIIELYDYLQGKKTNLIAALTAIYGLLSVFGVIVISPEQQTAINALIIAILGFTLHDAVVNQGKADIVIDGCSTINPADTSLPQ